MKTIDGKSEIGSRETIVALGVFDGVHLGHQALFREAARVRAETGLPLLALTFHPHPRTMTGHPDGYGRLLTPSAEKAALIEDCGADYLVTLPFTREMASTPARDFAAKYLARELGARHVVCGFSFTFGHRGAGKPQDLVEWGKELDFGVRVVPPFVAGDDAVSSTRIRAALDGGDVAEAALCLGRPYCVSGKVATGDGRGHRIGIPTSNLSVSEDKVLPGNGVYAAQVRVVVSGGKSSSTPGVAIRQFSAVVNVGTRPTFDGSGVRVEAHIPGFAGRLYGRGIQVFFVERLRDERRFPDAAALKTQVEQDIERVLAASRKARSFTLPRAYDRMLALELP